MERRGKVAEIRDQADQRIKPEPPACARHAKKPVEILRKIIKALFDLDLFSFLDFVHISFTTEAAGHGVGIQQDKQDVQDRRHLVSIVRIRKILFIFSVHLCVLCVNSNQFPTIRTVNILSPRTILSTTFISVSFTLPKTV